MMLSAVCLSVAYIGPKSRTERPRKTQISTEVAHVTRDSDTTFKVKRSKVKVTRPLCWRVRRLQRWAWERVAVGNCCYVAVCSVAQGASAPTGGGEERGHIVAATRLQPVTVYRTKCCVSRYIAATRNWCRNADDNGLACKQRLKTLLATFTGPVVHELTTSVNKH